MAQILGFVWKVGFESVRVSCAVCMRFVHETGFDQILVTVIICMPAVRHVTPSWAVLLKKKRLQFVF